MSKQDKQNDNVSGDPIDDDGQSSRLDYRFKTGSRSHKGQFSPQSTLHKMAEFGGKASIFESEALTLPGESLDISSGEIEALDTVEELDDSGINKQLKDEEMLKRLKESHANMMKLSYGAEKDELFNRYEMMKRSKAKKEKNDPLIGTSIDEQYKIFGVVGRGAAATVYKAKRLEDSRVVAIKTIRKKGLEDVWRFNLEIGTLERLAHKNLVEFIECIRKDKSEIYLIMELVKGISLQDVLNIHGPIVNHETVYLILSQIGEALKHAHQQGIVHRDLKANNVVLSKQVKQPLLVKVLDFGLAKHGDVGNITMHGMTLGSPLYMSPEQCVGEEPTNQSDIYSLGILAYQIISGVVPFIGETVTDIMSAHCDPDFKHFPLADVCPELRNVEKFDLVLDKCLEHSTEYRYKHIDEFQEDLKNWIVSTRS